MSGCCGSNVGQAMSKVLFAFSLYFKSWSGLQLLGIFFPKSSSDAWVLVDVSKGGGSDTGLRTVLVWGCCCCVRMLRRCCCVRSCCVRMLRRCCCVRMLLGCSSWGARRSCGGCCLPCCLVVGMQPLSTMLVRSNCTSGELPKKLCWRAVNGKVSQQSLWYASLAKQCPYSPCFVAATAAIAGQQRNVFAQTYTLYIAPGRVAINCNNGDGAVSNRPCWYESPE